MIMKSTKLGHNLLQNEKFNFVTDLSERMIGRGIVHLNLTIATNTIFDSIESFKLMKLHC